MKVEEIKEKLIAQGYEKKDLKKTKQELEDMLEKEMENDESIFDLAEEEEDSYVQPCDPEEVVPAYNSENWHNYVMSKFRDDELMDGSPTCDGCRRVVEELVGTIINSSIKEVTPPSVNNHGTSTVVVQIALMVHNDSHGAYNRLVTCEEVADVNKYNCDAPYHRYASATAASRAEGRALRKLLRLRNTITVEEVSEAANKEEEPWELDDGITDSQINVIDRICQRVNISVVEFINLGKNSYNDISEVKNSDAAKMIQMLNEMQQNKRQRPQKIGNYNNDWRKVSNNESDN